MDEGRKKLMRSLDWVTDVLKRYFEGKLNKQEEEIVEEHLKAIDRQTEGKTSMTENQLKASDERIRKQVFLRLQLDDPEKETGRPTLIPFKPNWPAFVPLFRKYAAIAAVFAAVIATSYFILDKDASFKTEHLASLQDKTILLQTGDTELKEVILPDGTKLYANSGTRIEYIKNEFNKEKREIWIEGEAFFDVAKNPQKPFVIHSNDIQTVVRGTSFNVKAYKEIGEISVSVRTGKVEVGTDDNTFAILTADKRVVYNEKTNRHVISKSNWEEEAAWRDHRLVLKDANISELKLRLKQLYGINITVDGDFLDDARFGLAFQKETSLNDVLEVISQLYNIKYRTTASGSTVIYQ